MSSVPVKAMFPVHEVVVLSGFSKHMLDYLAREDIFHPTLGGTGVRGRRRLYTYGDVVLLRALHSICANNGRIRQLKAALATLRSEIGPIVPGQRVDRLLFVQGNELCLHTEHEGSRQIRSGQMTFAFMVDLRGMSDDLAKVVHVDKLSGRVTLSRSAAEAAEVERNRAWDPIKRRRAAGSV